MDKTNIIKRVGNKKRIVSTIYNRDCRDVMQSMPEESITSIVTDPPYGTKFMGSKWDHGVPGQEFWEDALRVAKPGAFLLAFGGTRTYHRLACAIEDAGWEIRNCIIWMFGSGFPKSHNISKAIDKAAGEKRKVIGSKLGQPGYSLVTNKPDRKRYGQFTSAESECAITEATTTEAKQWEGWGTCLKPAFEPILLCRKPFKGTVASNVLEHGTGGINIDECRVGYSKNDDSRIGKNYKHNAKAGLENGTHKDNASGQLQQLHHTQGRFPANLIHDGSDEVLDVFPTSKDGTAVQRNRDGGVHNKIYGERKSPIALDSGYGGQGSAARFFYCAKSSKRDRGKDNDHPTVKPIALMEYLIKLVTCEGGVVLDPFMGSGSTGVACANLGRKFIGCEYNKEHGYFEIAKRRIEEAHGQEEKESSNNKRQVGS